MFTCVWLVAQSCPTLCDPMDLDCSLPVSSVHGILQVRALQWVAIPFARGSSRPRERTQIYCILQADSLPSEPPGKPECASGGILFWLKPFFGSSCDAKSKPLGSLTVPSCPMSHTFSSVLCPSSALNSFMLNAALLIHTFACTVHLLLE